jgi:hypothetical protein
VLSFDGDAHMIICHMTLKNLKSNNSYQYLLDAGINGKDPVGFGHLCRKADTLSKGDSTLSSQHFASTPYRKCSAHDAKRDCKDGNCIVSALTSYLRSAVDLKASRSVRETAIMFILHLLGDIHQPLHLGFEADTGGNEIKVYYPSGETIALHHFWDTNYPGASDNDHSGTAKDLLNHYKSEIASFKDILSIKDRSSPYYWEAISEALASETATTVTCPFAYQNENNKWIEWGDDMTLTYIKDRRRIAGKQLVKSGVRLAGIIDTLADVYYAKKNPKKPMKKILKKTVPISPQQGLFSALASGNSDTDEESSDEEEVIELPVKKLIQGLDIAELAVLPSADGHEYITSISLAESGEPSTLTPLKLTIKPKSVLSTFIDPRLLGGKKVSKDLNAALLKQFQREIEIMQDLALESPPVIEPTVLPDEKAFILSKKPELKVITDAADLIVMPSAIAGNVRIVTRAMFVNDSISRRVFRFNRIQYNKGGKGHTVFIDPKLFAGEPSGELLALIDLLEDSVPIPRECDRFLVEFTEALLNTFGKSVELQFIARSGVSVGKPETRTPPTFWWIGKTVV